jgi:hypothetical protein
MTQVYINKFVYFQLNFCVMHEGDEAKSQHDEARVDDASTASNSNIYVVFEKSTDGFMKKLVRAFAGKYVHCEIVTRDAHNEKNVYAAYMNECFSKTKLQEANYYTSNTHDVFRMPLDSNTHSMIAKNLDALAARSVPYNTYDALASPFNVTAFVRDCCKIESVKKVFCSQSIVMALRESFHPDTAIHQTVSILNSRTTTPLMLYSALKKHLEPAAIIDLYL